MKQNAALSIELDFESLKSNLNTLRGLCQHSQVFIASIKGNAYGLGAMQIAPVLEQCGVEMLATGNFQEARKIRQHGVSLPILLFAFGAAEESAAAAMEGFIPTITDFATAKFISASTNKPVEIYIKVDAGLGRLGIPLTSAQQTIEQIIALKNIQVGGIYTHVPFADSLGREWSKTKLVDFQLLLDRLADTGIQPKITQAMASSCLVAGLNDQCNAVCVGHAMYGLSPYGYDDVADMTVFHPVLKRLHTKLIHIGEHQPGDDLVIAGQYKITEPRKLGILPIGMSDGIQNAASGEKFFVLVRGYRAPVISVSLEHTTIDLDGIDDCSTGDAVYLVGTDGNQHIGLDELAKSWGIPPLETLIRLSVRAEKQVL